MINVNLDSFIELAKVLAEIAFGIFWVRSEMRKRPHHRGNRRRKR